MLINHDTQFLFLHSPKCAGISLSNWLIDHYGFSYYNNPDYRCGDVVERHRYEIPEEFSEYEIVTCIREPFKRWESFFLYQTLQMDADLTFEEFTRERLNWLPRQSLYTQNSTHILRFEQLESDVCKLPFVRHPMPTLPVMNVSRDQVRYEEAKSQIGWTIELRSLVAAHFKDDFDL